MTEATRASCEGRDNYLPLFGRLFHSPPLIGLPSGDQSGTRYGQTHNTWGDGQTGATPSFTCSEVPFLRQRLFSPRRLFSSKVTFLLFRLAPAPPDLLTTRRATGPASRPPPLPHVVSPKACDGPSLDVIFLLGRHQAPRTDRPGDMSGAGVRPFKKFAERHPAVEGNGGVGWTWLDLKHLEPSDPA